MCSGCSISFGGDGGREGEEEECECVCVRRKGDSLTGGVCACALGECMVCASSILSVRGEGRKGWREGLSCLEETSSDMKKS